MINSININTWWQKGFEKDYLTIQNFELSKERTHKEVDFIVKSAKILKTDKILDLACGFGRHSIELSKRGYNVVGIDYSKTNLNIARSKARQQHLPVTFIRKDIRRLSYNKEFDVVLFLYSSFGYFSNRENLNIIHKISNSLIPNGKLLIDVYNANKLFSDIKSHGTRVKKSLYEHNRVTKTGPFVYVDKDILSLKNQRVKLYRKWRTKNANGEYFFNIRHYTLQEYKKILPKYNLNPTQIWGSYSNLGWTNDSVRTIILAKKTTKKHSLLKSRFVSILKKYLRHE